MYYTYPCPYCGKIFYTYNKNKEQASHVLYNGIKQHLIDYKEDEKEYEMDDGEQMDSDQIYYGMKELSYAPVGGYQATVDGISKTTSSYPSSSLSSSSSSSSSGTLFLLFLLILLIGVVVILVVFPDILSNLKGMLLN